MGQKNKIIDLNGFTVCLLGLGIVNSVIGIVLDIMGIAQEEIEIGVGVYDIIARAFVIFFLIKLLQTSKVGLYGYSAVVVANIVASFIICDGEYSLVFHQMGVNACQVAILFACLLFLKSNGVSGWNAIFKKNSTNEEGTESNTK